MKKREEFWGEVVNACQEVGRGKVIVTLTVNDGKLQKVDIDQGPLSGHAAGSAGVIPIPKFSVGR